MTDTYGRNIDYMRVSITDRCNLRCRYCMPLEGIEWVPAGGLLTLEEISQVCAQAAQIGIRKIKLTGGEPLMRKGCAALVGMLKAIPGIEQVTLTTNGTLLARHAKELYENGVTAVNVSLDTLDPEKYREITGSCALEDVLLGIAEMERYPVPLKINSVLQRGVNEDGWLKLVELAKDRPLDVRFIEMMPIGLGKEFEAISNKELLEKLEACYGPLTAEKKPHGNGPALYYRLPGFQGCIGFISAIHGKFCGQCNRIRLTSVGQVKPCLCYAKSFSVKEAVRSGQDRKVQQILQQAIMDKPKSHCFEAPRAVTEQQEMARIGG